MGKKKPRKTRKPIKSGTGIGRPPGYKPRDPTAPFRGTINGY
ncbi:hypothetical protein [Aeromicrobium sp. PE09-221]|nr:hypothetical protein [Aeromicrobium sp. PE09-221]